MSYTPRILVFAGSARKDSCNKKLARMAAEAVTAAGGVATYVDLADYPAPLYDGDLEAGEGSPESMRKLRQLFLEHDGLLISSPEFNSSVTPLMKNTIDWVSREGGKGSLTPYQGKVAGLLACSPGALGGLRGLVHLRAILGNIGVLVLPTQFAIGAATLEDPATGEKLARLAKELVETVGKLKGEGI